MPRSQSFIPLVKKLEVKRTNCGGKKERNRNKTGNKIRLSKDRLYNFR